LSRAEWTVSLRPLFLNVTMPSKRFNAEGQSLKHDVGITAGILELATHGYPHACLISVLSSALYIGIELQHIGTSVSDWCKSEEIERVRFSVMLFCRLA
jgi:hypothetical protein